MPFDLTARSDRLSSEMFLQASPTLSGYSIAAAQIGGISNFAGNAEDRPLNEPTSSLLRSGASTMRRANYSDSEDYALERRSSRPRSLQNRQRAQRRGRRPLTPVRRPTQRVRSNRSSALRVPGAPRLRDRRLQNCQDAQFPFPMPELPEIPGAQFPSRSSVPQIEIRRSSLVSLHENEAGGTDVVVSETTRMRNSLRPGPGARTEHGLFPFPPRPSGILFVGRPGGILIPGIGSMFPDFVTQTTSGRSTRPPPPPLPLLSSTPPLPPEIPPQMSQNPEFLDENIDSDQSVLFQVAIRPCRRKGTLFSSEFPSNLSSRPYKYRVALTCKPKYLPRAIEFYLSHSDQLEDYSDYSGDYDEDYDLASLEFEIVNGGGVNYAFLGTESLEPACLHRHLFEIQFGPASFRTRKLYRLHVGEREMVLEGETPETKEIQVREFFKSNPFMLYVRKSKAEEAFWKVRTEPKGKRVVRGKRPRNSLKKLEFVPGSEVDLRKIPPRKRRRRSRTE